MWKKGIAFRGHRDDCFNWEDTEYEHSNPGNFIELVCFRAETDNILSEHLKNSPRNARYTSKTIQNELIEVVGKYICNEIIAEVKKIKYYTVIVDEVTDISNKEQLSISLRYVYYPRPGFPGGGYSSRSTTVRLTDRIYSWLAEMQMKLVRPIDEKWCHY